MPSIILSFIIFSFLQISTVLASPSEIGLLAYNQKTDSTSLDKEPSEVFNVRDQGHPTTAVPSPYSPEAETFQSPISNPAPKIVPKPKPKSKPQPTPVVRDTYKNDIRETYPEATETGKRTDLPPGWEEEEELPPNAIRLEDLTPGKKQRSVENPKPAPAEPVHPVKQFQEIEKDLDEEYIPPREEIKEIAPPPEVGPVDVRNIPTSSDVPVEATSQPVNSYPMPIKKKIDEQAPETDTPKAKQQEVQPKKVYIPVKTEATVHKIKTDLPEEWEEVEVPAGKVRLEDLQPGRLEIKK